MKDEKVRQAKQKHKNGGLDLQGENSIFSKQPPTPKAPTQTHVLSMEIEMP